jgi:microcystin degradation protein MlrC
VRIAVAEVAQETDSFSPLRAGLAEFESYGLYRGAEILERMQGAGPLGGFLEIAARQPAVELVPILRAWGGAGGPILDTVFQQFRQQLLEGLRTAGPPDAIFLAMHGAACSETEDDVEGALLADVRQLLGDKIPIVVPLDHHANITTRMATHADLLVGHETQPHDPPATGRKAARLLFRLLAGEIAPVRAWQKIPMITPQDQYLTAAGPMKAWFDRAREFEREPGVLDVSPYPMQPWLDVAEGGWAVVVHTNSQPERAREIAAEMANLAWSLRREFWRSERFAPAEAVAQAVAFAAGNREELEPRRRSQGTEVPYYEPSAERSAGSGLIILSDTGDSVYGGAPGDNTVLLRELVRQSVPCLSLVPVVDEQAVAAAMAAGVAASVTLTVGGRHDCRFSQPVTLQGRVAAVSEGVTAEIPDRGVTRLGRTALVECGELRVVLLDHRSFAINHPILYAHLGVDLNQARIVVVKTASNFQYFAPWRKQLLRVDTPGTTQSNLAAFEWHRLPRPIDPFDDLPAWEAQPAVLPMRGLR